MRCTRPLELDLSLKARFNCQLTQVASLVLQSSIRPSTNRHKLSSRKYIHLSALGPLVHATFLMHLNWTSYSVGRMLMRSYVSCTVATLRFTLFSWWTYRRVSSACSILYRYETIDTTSSGQAKGRQILGFCRSSRSCIRECMRTRLGIPL